MDNGGEQEVWRALFPKTKGPPGNDLLSQGLAPQVPSALAGLTRGPQVARRPLRVPLPGSEWSRVFPRRYNHQKDLVLSALSLLLFTQP